MAGLPDVVPQFQEFVAQLPDWLQPAGVALAGAVPFVEGEGAAAIGVVIRGVIAFAGSILVLFFVPWLDTSKVRSGTFRPIFKWFYWLFVLNFLMLVYLGAQDPSVVIYNYLAKLGTAYYFIYFLIILPVLSRIETPRPLPVSISQSVLGKAHS